MHAISCVTTTTVTVTSKEKGRSCLALFKTEKSVNLKKTTTMNEMEKFVTIFCVICGVYSVYEKCEANPRNGCRGMFFNFVFH